MLRRPSLLVLGVVVSLAFGAAPTLAQDLTSTPVPRPALPSSSEAPARAVARATLNEAERAFAGRAGTPEVEGGRGLTLLLRDLRATYDDLAPAERSRADRLFARPDGDPDGMDLEDAVFYDEQADPANDCQVAPTIGSNVCVHWARVGVHRPDPQRPKPHDTDGDGVPDYVEQVRDAFNHVWGRIVVEGGYRQPLSDSTSTNSGPDGRLDVYLADLGKRGYYGYCNSDDPEWEYTNRISAYCVLDNDYASGQYGDRNTSADMMRATAAHEFFHAVQFAYDAWEDAWLMEASAAWVEDEIYDSINDNRQYLKHSPLGQPAAPLDYSAEDYRGEYGAWIFLRYLSERFPATAGTGMPVIIRKVWERVASPSGLYTGDYSIRAIARELSARGVEFPRFFQDFALANRRPAAFYEEGAAYKKAVARPDFTLAVRQAKRLRFEGRPYHLSAGTVRLKPGKKFAGKNWRLKVDVDMPKRAWGYGTAVTVHLKSGKVRTQPVRLNAAGDGAVKVPFNRKQVRYVEVTLTNASTRYKCWQHWESPYSCYGSPRDDDRRVLFGVRAVKR